jgi:hypothetical protein
MAKMVRAKRPRPSKRSKSARHNSGHFKPISVEEACRVGHFSRPHFYRIRKHLETRHLGRRLLVNEHSVYAYLRSLPE